MFSSLSKFHIYEDYPLPFFTSSSIDLSPPLTNITSSDEQDILPLDQPTLPASPDTSITDPNNTVHYDTSIIDPDLSHDPSASIISSSNELLIMGNRIDDTTSVDPVSQSAVPPLTWQSTRVKEFPCHLRDYHYYSTIFSHHKPSFYKETNFIPH